MDLDLRATLAGGDRRSIGRVAEVVAAVLANSALLADLVAGLRDTDPVFRMRCADALEKATAHDAAGLQPFKAELLGLLASEQQQEVRWHLAQLVPRLTLNAAERRSAVVQLRAYLEDRSRIVRTFAMQALADLAADDDSLRAEVVSLMEECVRTGSPAMRSRGRRLLAALARGGERAR